MSTTPELKPCPCCGADAVLSIDITGITTIFQVKCSVITCGLGGAKETDRHKAIAAWNRRSAAPSSTFAGYFRELKSGMSYRLWEQGGAEQQEGEVALYTSPVEAPPGFVLVPLEPTPEMLEAAWAEEVSLSDAHTEHGVTLHVWNAMLSARPTGDKT